MTRTTFGIIGISLKEFKERLDLTDEQFHKFCQDWRQREEELTKLRNRISSAADRADLWSKKYFALDAICFDLLHEIKNAHGLTEKYALMDEAGSDPLLLAALKLDDYLERE